MSRLAGARAEDLAASALVERGHRILHRNYTLRGGELDLVTRAPDGTVCFVEVRARRSSDFGTPAETISRQKRLRLVKAARHYLATKASPDAFCRFDVVEVLGEAPAAAVNVIENAFTLDDL
jgi:putative endonuclease